MEHGQKIKYIGSGDKKIRTGYFIKLNDEGFHALISTANPQFAPGVRHWAPIDSISAA